jgi:hypothetical protein
MDAKGWGTPDIVMEETQVELSTEPWWDVFLPLVWKGAMSQRVNEVMGDS